MFRFLRFPYARLSLSCSYYTPGGLGRRHWTPAVRAPRGQTVEWIENRTNKEAQLLQRDRATPYVT